MRRLACIAVTVGSLTGGAQAADDPAALEARVRALAERMERLEQRNQELEREVADWRRRSGAPSVQGGAAVAAEAPAAAQPAAVVQRSAGASTTESPSPLEARVRALEETQARTERSLASDRLSESEPELVTRLKAVEVQTSSMQKQARQIEALEGISVAGSLTTMAQRVGSGGSDTGVAQSRLGYRGDLSVTLPGGSYGSAEGSIFAHLRFGQGQGIGVRRALASTNSTAFEVTGVVPDSDSSFAILAQAWYQLSVPLGDEALPSQSRRHLFFNVGKIDPFVFFDQNAIADDESVRFTNNAFVHNPLLDAGGDVGADEYGFSPGVRAAYIDESDAGSKWSASVGAFGSGSAANFSGSPGRPFLIGQLEASPRLFQGLSGNYRIYAWRNPRATDFDDSEALHAGWGMSIDQRVTDDLTLFGRFGQRTSGHGRFDRAFTLGAELDGDGWRRAADGVGFAIGWLGISDEFRRATGAGEVPDFADKARGYAHIAELYYRYRFNDRVEITPDLQWLRHAGGDPHASTRTIVGLRARVGF